MADVKITIDGEKMSVPEGMTILEAAHGAGINIPTLCHRPDLTNCIGACDRAPAMLVDDEVYGELTPAKIKEILQSYH